MHVFKLKAFAADDFTISEVFNQVGKHLSSSL